MLGLVPTARWAAYGPQAQTLTRKGPGRMLVTNHEDVVTEFVQQRRTYIERIADRAEQDRRPTLAIAPNVDGFHPVA
jgi:hypothetical protein